MWSQREELHLGRGDFLSRRKRPVDQAAVHAEARFGFRPAEDAHDVVKARQGLAGPVFADLAEEAVFDGIPFGSAGGIVTDGDGETEGVDQLFLQFPFPGANPRTVAAAAIGQDQESAGVRIVLASVVAPPVSDIVRRQRRRVMGSADEDRALIAGQIENAAGGGNAVGLRAEVVVQHRGWLPAPDATWILEVADQFLLLGVDTDDRQRWPVKSPPLALEAEKLTVALRMRLGDGLAIGL